MASPDVRVKGPKLVTTDELTSGKGGKAKVAKLPLKTADLLLPIVAASYGAASYLTKHEHWKLEEQEAHELTQALAAALDTLPAGTLKSVQKSLEKYAPWVGLALTAGAITAPRIQLTREINRVRSASIPPHDPRTGAQPAPPAAASAGPGRGEPGSEHAGAPYTNGRPGPTALRVLGSPE